MASLIDLLASSQGLKSNEANTTLAKEIASTDNKDAVSELITHLKDNDKKIQSDCIKTLYEIGYRNPGLIAEYYQVFLHLLNHKNNRMIWGAMIALSTITDLKPREIFESLDQIMETIRKGSVITVDGGVDILSKLNRYREFFHTTDPLLMEQLWNCPIKQLPLYTEKALISITRKNKEGYRNILIKRKQECEKDSQLRRLERIIKFIDAL